MKFKKILLSASALAAGSSLVATALVSCSKSSIDEDLKMTLDDAGRLTKNGTYKDAVQYALSRSTNWATFKQAFADELVFKWYTDRMADSKDDTKKNTTFRINYDDWQYQIEKDYDNIVSNCKSKYSNNWEFYLQNDYLAPYGGTRDGYIHAKLVDKVKADFVSKVFATSYFGYRTADETSFLPQIFTHATTTVDSEVLNNPATWSQLGFYARTNSSFAPTGDTRGAINTDYLAKYPDGDYAIIQNYVFNRWFDTEKPFFSAAALFKYSEPKHVASAKLSEIYDGTFTGAKIPDKCNESFPFFGFSEYSKGTKAFKEWYERLADGEYESDTYQEEAGGEFKENMTVTMPRSVTEDTQTLLLCTANNMITTNTGSLYVPYAMAASNLYMLMLGIPTQEDVAKNKAVQSTIEASFNAEHYSTVKDDFAVLNNFFFKILPQNEADATRVDGHTILSYLDLNTVYGGLSGTGEDADHPYVYHCPLFKNNKDYTYLYGDTTATGTFQDKDGKYWSNATGVRYITNNVQVNLAPTVEGKTTHTQPWILELNESGMHAQTIDGYRYVVEQSDRKAALKNVIKYRLMQHKCGYNKDQISTKLLDDNGELKTYFNDNFANIIIEIAESDDKDVNIFRPITEYTKETTENLLLYTICSDQGFESAEYVKKYLDAIITYDISKKKYDAYTNANTRIYDYRKKQIENSKFDANSKTIFENGLLAPIPYSCVVDTNFETTRSYYDIVKVIALNEDFTGIDVTFKHQTISDAMSAVKDTDLYKSIANVAVNTTNAFSPQIQAAKDASSNRFWYKSAIVDKMMYALMGSKATVNAIKQTTYETYTDNIMKLEGEDKLKADAALEAFTSVYAGSKLLTGDLNYSSYVKQGDTTQTFWKNLWDQYLIYIDNKILADGRYCDENLNLHLYLATCAYLLKDNFTNFYKVMNAKISDDEKALVGYVNKFDINHEETTYLEPIKTVATANTTNYDWSADVNNIYDQHGYTDQKGTSENTTEGNSRIACDQYWNVVSKDFNVAGVDAKTFAGFTGLQTKSSNQLDSSSGLQAAAFTNLAQSSYKTYDLVNNKGDSLDQNYGCWFAWAGTYPDSSKSSMYTFDNLNWTDKEGQVKTITSKQFSDQAETQPMLKLAKRIVEDGTMDNLRALAKSLGESFMGDSVFKKIGNGTYPITSKDVLNEMKYVMLNTLLTKTDGVYDYAKCFKRLVNAQLHKDCTSIGSAKWYFTDKNIGYQFMMTQINKSDVIEKTITPTWSDGKWTMNSALTIEEFFNIFSKIAMESSVQQLVISEAVKNVYGDDKLIVYDAQIYNQFDSTWIKDWKKKPIGGEGK